VLFHALVKYDHGDGSATRDDYGPGGFASEAPFARRVGGSEEDDGYVVSIASHEASFESQAWVFSAREIERGPIARVKLPSRVPTGFHAKWIPGHQIWRD
jgi:carotenoid cleavage dioxygenase